MQQQDQTKTPRPSEGNPSRCERPLLLIEWADSYGCSANWQKIQIESVSPLVCRSVGWLAYDGEECKVIIPHVAGHDHAFVDEQGCGDMTIPTRAIIRIAELFER